jgi:hypothetical protein
MDELDERALAGSVLPHHRHGTTCRNVHADARHRITVGSGITVGQVHERQTRAQAARQGSDRRLCRSVPPGVRAGPDRAQSLESRGSRVNGAELRQPAGDLDADLRGEDDGQDDVSDRRLPACGRVEVDKDGDDVRRTEGALPGGAPDRRAPGR